MCTRGQVSAGHLPELPYQVAVWDGRRVHGLLVPPGAAAGPAPPSRRLRSSGGAGDAPGVHRSHVVAAAGALSAAPAAAPRCTERVVGGCWATALAAVAAPQAPRHVPGAIGHGRGHHYSLERQRHRAVRLDTPVYPRDHAWGGGGETYRPDHVCLVWRGQVPGSPAVAERPISGVWAVLAAVNSCSGGGARFLSSNHQKYAHHLSHAVQAVLPAVLGVRCSYLLLSTCWWQFPVRGTY